LISESSLIFSIFVIGNRGIGREIVRQIAAKEKVFPLSFYLFSFFSFVSFFSFPFSFFPFPFFLFLVLYILMRQSAVVVLTARVDAEAKEEATSIKKELNNSIPTSFSISSS